MSTTDPAAETLPTPPNPYRFTVDIQAALSCWWVDVLDAPHSITRSWLFSTREEAEHHASLILSALHQAAREDT